MIGKKQLLLLSSLLVLSGLTGLSGCSGSEEELCREDFPRLEQGISLASARLQGGEGRFLASSSFDEKERVYWADWSLEQLKKAQYYADTLELETKRGESMILVSEIANEFVTIHGFASAGRLHPMKDTLERVMAKTRRLKQLVCGT